jgi:Reverse transcriptase (RNA-dependent DNA polymerase)
MYHEGLYKVLNTLGVRGRFLDMVKAMYKGTEYSVHVGDHISEPFLPTRGAKQGDPLSPMLFILYIDKCLEKASSSGGIHVNRLSRRCPGLLYADDLVLWDSGLEGVQESLD